MHDWLITCEHPKVLIRAKRWNYSWSFDLPINLLTFLLRNGNVVENIFKVDVNSLDVVTVQLHDKAFFTVSLLWLAKKFNIHWVLATWLELCLCGNFSASEKHETGKISEAKLWNRNFIIIKKQIEFVLWQLFQFYLFRWVLCRVSQLLIEDRNDLPSNVQKYLI